MTQALHIEDGSSPQGLTVQNAYTELQSSSKSVAVVVRNSTTYPQTLRKKAPVARAVAVTQIPELPMQIGLKEVSAKGHGHQMSKLTVKQWQEKLFEELDLSRLESLAPELVGAARSLLAEYHNVFSLEPGGLGCTHSMTHTFKVTDDTPFKEIFRWIPPPLVEVVQMHLWEMLDSGTIHPSQSMWCNTVVLVWKKDGGPCFYIDFWCPSAHTKKDSYPLTRIQEALESLVSVSCLDLKSRFWQVGMDESLKQYIAFAIGSQGFLGCGHIPFGLCGTPATFQQLMQDCLGELGLIYCLVYLDDMVVFPHTAEEHLHCLHVFDRFGEHSLRLQPLVCSFFKKEVTCLAH